jgi:molybdate transport system ATP-binding protein
MSLATRLQKRVEGFALDMELEAAQGLTVLFGPSGAGKSMTLRLIAGLLRPDAGEVTLGGRKLFSSTEHIDITPQKRNIGYVFQNHALFPHMTVVENVIFGAKGLPDAQARGEAKSLLLQFGLEAHADKYPREISGGERQRAAFARAAIRRPALMLLDEPFSALDLKNRVMMRGWLREWSEKFSIPVLCVTHDAQDAAEADSVIFMENGRPAQKQDLPVKSI